MTDPTQIAAKLSKAQREAVLWLPADGMIKFIDRPGLSQALNAVGTRKLIKRFVPSRLNQRIEWSLTPLGREVRAILVGKEGVR